MNTIPLHRWPFRMVAAYALAYMAPMVAMWFIAPLVREGAERWNAPLSGWSFDWFLLIPYPTPFTWRAAAGLAIIFVPPAVFIATWFGARAASRDRGIP